MDDMYPLDMMCGTCHCQRATHFKTYDGLAYGCMRMVGRETSVQCPCTGFMATESETSRNEHLNNIGKAVFRVVVARQNAQDGAKYRAALP